MRSLVMMALFAACGDNEGGPDTCLPEGGGDAVAVVAGEQLGPFARAAQFPVDTLHALVLDETAGTCGEAAMAGKQLVLLLCEPPEQKNYRIVPEQAFRCPGNEVLAVVERGGGADLAKSTTGTLMIEAAAGCVRGSYAITLSTLDTIEGAFDAIVCTGN